MKWITDNDRETELVSGSTDKTAIVWTLRGTEYIPYVLSGHESNVNVVEGLCLDNITKNSIVVTASVDSTIRVWIRSSENGMYFTNYSFTILVGIVHSLF